LVLPLGLLTLGLMPVLALGFAVPCGLTAERPGLVVDFAVAAFGRLADLAAVARVDADDFAAVLGLAVLFGFAVAFGLAAVLDFRVVVFALAVVLAAGRALVVRVLALVVRDLTAVRALAPAGLTVRDLAPAGLTVRDLAVLFGLAVALGLAVLATAAGLADDMVLAAVVSDLAAVVMALVAVFIACMAVDIVLAEELAFVAAAVILLAAEVTLVAADETVRAAEAADGAVLDALRVVLTAVALVLPLVFGRLAARLDALRLVDRVRVAVAGLRRAAVRVVVRAGTDLPPY
jgi:hypothetical protein